MQPHHGPGTSELRHPPSGVVQQAKVRDLARRCRRCFWDRGGEVEEEGKAAAAAGGGSEVEEGDKGEGRPRRRLEEGGGNGTWQDGVAGS